MNFEENEDANGVRLTWNHVPKSKLQHHRNIAPLAAFYTPLNNKSEVKTLHQTHMSRCRQCKAFLNPYVTVSQAQGDVWYCQFCSFGNRLVGEGGFVSAAVEPDSTTVEYITGRVGKLPSIFLYVVDTCFEGEDVEDAYVSLKETLSLSLSLLPVDAVVGFVSFGKHVQIHDLATPNVAHMFNGAKDYALEDVQRMLDLGAATTGALTPSAQRFFQPVDVAEYNLSGIIDTLANITFPHDSKDRLARASGCAMNVASLTLQAIIGKSASAGGHIMCFIGGAATYGPGRIVGLPLKEPIRSHHDIDRARTALANVSTMANGGVAKVDTSLFKQSRDFYDKVAQTLVGIGISCNLFVGSYDQMGLYEMDRVCASTGGMVVMCDSFSTSMFKQSVVKFFKKETDDPDSFLEMALNCTLECRVTKDFQIQGLVGNASALPLRKDKFVEGSISPVSVGEGGTNAWKLCGVNPKSTYAVFFDKLDSSSVGSAFIQFTFHYQHPSGELRLRVTTIPLAIIADSDPQNLEYGFDQEAALVAVARSSIDKLIPSNHSGKASSFNHADVTKHLDQLLVDYCSRFAQYKPGDLMSFRLSNSYGLFPQFMYHLRRSQFIRVFNNSPDETAFVRHCLMQEDVMNSLIMIQPSLLSYDVDTFGAFDEEGNPNNEPEPVLLDSMSLGANKILLLDTFFQILIYHGSTVAQWRKANYHTMEGYEHFKEFLEAPKKEAMMILMDRFPLPRFIDCDEGGSQTRFLMAKLNPSTSYAATPEHLFGGQIDVKTDDTSLQMFMDRIQRIVVLAKK